MSLKVIPPLGFIFTLLASPLAHGSLSLVIDPINKTFSFSGSASGTPMDLPNGGLTRWVAANIGFEPGVVEKIILSDDQTFSTSEGTTGGSFNFDTVINTDETNGGSLSFMLVTSTGSFQTLSGLNNPKSYASLNAANELRFESLIGKSLPLATGSGFGTLSVVAVPEPSTWLLALVGSSALILRRRV